MAKRKINVNFFLLTIVPRYYAIQMSAGEFDFTTTAEHPRLDNASYKKKPPILERKCNHFMFFGCYFVCITLLHDLCV